ncbi:MAG: GNAT family N-acetyltransferase [Clostridia bacterium]|nr:GNAT family N-acetyltransferase [Clostridia bacterium]
MAERSIHLEKVTYDNVRSVCRLRVAKDQKGFVARNDESLIEAYLTLSVGDPVFPFAILRGETVVGFIMIDFDDDWEGYGHEAWLCSGDYKFYKGKSFYYIWRFMIDKKYQGRGYGKEALKLALDFIRTFPCGAAEYCVLSYEPSNEAAKKLYSSFGFVELNEPGYYEEGEEISAVLKL